MKIIEVVFPDREMNPELAQSLCLAVAYVNGY
jgi:hypothetical protein